MNARRPSCSGDRLWASGDRLRATSPASASRARPFTKEPEAGVGQPRPRRRLKPGPPEACRPKPDRRSPEPERSVHRQVPLDLPRRHVPDVVVPLLALGGDEVLEQVAAKRFSDEVVLLQFVERFAQIARQLVDSQMPALAMAHREDVLVDRRPGINLLVDAVET